MNYNIEHFASNTLSSHGNTEETMHFAPHLHNHYELNLFISGDISFFIDGELFKPTKGDLFLINSTRIHGPKILSKSSYERAIIHFSSKLIQLIPQESLDLLKIFEKKNIIHLNQAETQDFIQITDKLQNLEEINQELFGKNILMQVYLIEILILINQTATNCNLDESFLTNDELSPIVSQIIHLIQENLDQPISLNTIEKKLNMNKHYLNRLFKTELGISIYQFIQLNKISLAKKLLYQGISVTEVCDQLAYKDYSTFARAFKRVTELSPTNYVKSML